jgi:hypothetical protein
MNKTYFYKVIDRDSNYIGVGSSDSLCKYNEKYQKMILASESSAQYIIVNGQIYRIPWLNPENQTIAGKYPMARMFIISEEEYNNLRKI